MPSLGVVSDDLTGATTTAVLMARSKSRCAVFFNEEDVRSSDYISSLGTIIISTGTRAMQPDSAYAKVCAATRELQKLGVQYYSKRIDTTCRGGIGVELDAMMDVIGNDVVSVVVPAMPQSRRILVGGFSVIDGVALINTPVAQDVRTPVHENYIPRLLSLQSRRKVELIKLDTVLRGREAIREELIRVRSDGAGIIVVDAISLEDTREIAAACSALDWNILSSDPGVFTAQLAYFRGIAGIEEPNCPQTTADGSGKTVLIAAGSATPVTRKQIDCFLEDERHKCISVSPIGLIDGDAEIERSISEAVELLRSKPRAVVFETALYSERLDLDAEDRKRALTPGSCADRINSGIGRILAGVIDRSGVENIAGIYATGGDTMVRVCQSLGASSFEALDYVIAQVDVGRLTGRYAGLPIIGKGGLTGHDHIVSDIVDRLFKEATRKP